MGDSLVFSWQTAVLAVPMLIMLSAAAALTQPLHNRTANRLLAVFLILLASVCAPWAIGFAQFYNKWPWLTFAPFAIPLALAPLLYGYLHALVTGRTPDRFPIHLIPAALQFTFLTVSFILPLELKNQWAAASSTSYDIVIAICFLIGSVAYFIAGRNLLRPYRAWLAENRSDDDRFAAAWIGRALTIMATLIAIWMVFEIRDRIAPLGYSGLMGLYIALAGFGVLFAFEGWRHAALPFPHFDRAEELEQDLAPSGEATGKDWTEIAQEWAQRIRSERLYRDPELSMTRLARLLGTNQTYLSRALNDGLGLNFSTFINRLRSEEVASQLMPGVKIDILSTALDAGFNSKASFNRSFKERYDMTPSAYRSQKSQIR